MATAVRKQNVAVSIVEDLFAQCYVYEFHQAIKLLEIAFKDTTSLGTGSIPEAEVVSLKSRVDYAYPPSDLFSLKLASSQKDTPYPCELKVNFLGIAGTNGPLPMPFSERLMERVRSGDTAFRDFLDIFNHRILSLLHRIRKK